MYCTVDRADKAAQRPQEPINYADTTKECGESIDPLEECTSSACVARPPVFPCSGGNACKTDDTCNAPSTCTGLRSITRAECQATGSQGQQAQSTTMARIAPVHPSATATVRMGALTCGLWDCFCEERQVEVPNSSPRSPSNAANVAPQARLLERANAFEEFVHSPSQLWFDHAPRSFTARSCAAWAVPRLARARLLQRSPRGEAVHEGVHGTAPWK